MIDESTEKTDRKVNGKFSLGVGDNPDIYAPSQVIKDLEEKLEAEKEALKKLRKGSILILFQAVVHEHEVKFGVPPTKVVLNYREFGFLVDAHNDIEGVRYQSTYADTAEIYGITICKGCTTEPAEFELRTRM
jgi:hypothetical protein